MLKPEILAPVGKKESLKVSINNGADAVYLGIDEFNARGNIENFTLENLKEAVDYAHLFNVKVYLTLNILFKDDEFNRVCEILEKASFSGVDAFIIQDIGLYYFIKHNFPNLEIHASTQMGIQNIEGAKFLKDLGYKRLVLARETSLTDIEKIYKELKIDLEYFVQGALCVSFSGNCYLCSMLAGSSGNRGKCKQYCRLPFSLVNKDKEVTGYLLSTKDFCMLPYLKELSNVGVKSFKIEGRARRESYVGQAVNTYRKVVDNNFKYNEEDILNLKKVFNRGDYISGYFANEKIIYNKAQNHMGIGIGKVLSVNNGKKFNEIKIFSTYNLKKDDVLKFYENDKEVGIITVKDIKEISKNTFIVTTTNVIPKFAQVRLIVDSENENKILDNKRQINITAYFEGKINTKAKLTLFVNGTKVTCESEENLQEAKNNPLTQEECFNQISKLGENFKLENLTTNLDNVFMAKSQLNNLRRSAIEKLQQEILKQYSSKENLSKKAEKHQKNVEIFNINQKVSEILAFNDIKTLENLDKNNDILIFKSNNFNKDFILPLYEKYKDLNIYLSLPVLATQKEVEYLKELICACENWGIVANNYYALNLKEQEKVIIGENMNVYNSYAVKFYAEKGYKNIIVSNEIENFDKINNNGVNLFYYSEYYPEYMNFNHCPIKENIGGDCQNCKFDFNYKYKLNNTRFNLVRRKILKCQFIMKAENKVNRTLNENISKIKEIY